MKYQSRIQKKVCSRDIDMENYITYLGKLFFLFGVWLFYLVVFKEKDHYC